LIYAYANAIAARRDEETWIAAVWSFVDGLITRKSFTSEQRELAPAGNLLECYVLFLLFEGGDMYSYKMDRCSLIQLGDCSIGLGEKTLSKVSLCCGSCK